MDHTAADGPEIRLAQIADISVRALILWIIDLIMNGGLSVLIAAAQSGGSAVENGTMISVTFGDLIFALDRQKFNDVYKEMNWTVYLSWSVFYVLLIFGFVMLFMSQTDYLSTLSEWAGPLVLVLLAIYMSLNASTGKYKPTNLLLSMLNSRFYRVVSRAGFGYFASRLYLKIRSRIFRDMHLAIVDHYEAIGITRGQLLAKLLLCLPFFMPMAMIICDLASYTSVVFTIFAPVLVTEIMITTVIWRRLIVGISQVIENARRTAAVVGWQTFIADEWSHMHVMHVLRTFWWSRIAVQALYIVYVGLLNRDDDWYGAYEKRPHLNWLLIGQQFEQHDETNLIVDETSTDLCMTLEYFVARCCETFPAILATTSMVVLLGRWMGDVFWWVLTGKSSGIQSPGQQVPEADEEQENVGALTGVLFIILCLQTGLSGLTVEKRLQKFYRNSWLLCMALLHFVQHMVSKVMSKLCTTGRFGWMKHARVVLVGLFLLAAPNLFFSYTWRRSNWKNPWLISVAIFAIELIVKMVSSFVIYVLMLLDLVHPRRATDDLLYLVKCIGAVAEFMFGIILFLNGIWILAYEQGGILRTAMICVHAYCNIYLRGRQGLSQLMRRREATRKLNLLQMPSIQQLMAMSAADDNCSVCFDTLCEQPLVNSNVRITTCGHCFHAGCLMKWLYVRDFCPLCHRNVFPETENSSDSAAQQVAQDISY